VDEAPSPPPLSAERREILERYGRFTHLLETAFRVPGTNWRFGIEPLIGLIPGIGDMTGAILGGYGLLVARRLGAPSSVQWRMLVNIALDALVGAAPVFGDWFDFAFKAHVRNRQLLERWLGSPSRTRRSSRAIVMAIPVALVLIGGGAIALVANREKSDRATSRSSPLPGTRSATRDP
jgi:hypothetical protein